MGFFYKALESVRSIPFVGPSAGKLLNQIATNRFCKKARPRPRAFSLWSHVKKPTPLNQQGPVGEYTTWPMLTDRLYSSRHLPPADQSYISGLPQDTKYNSANGVMGDVTALFARVGAIDEGRSSVLFMFFAQWFTDSILRVHPIDRRKNTSNHNIDLCQIYGLTEQSARTLRDPKGGGKLRSQKIDGEEYLDYLGELGNDNKWKVKKHYMWNEAEGTGLPYTDEVILDNIINIFKNFPDESETSFQKRKQKLYATGLERGNSSVGYVAISTLFMREHNRICGELATRNPNWANNDERLFQTARMINIAILLKLVVQDYINHIVGYKVFTLDPSFAEEQDWYRTPWIALEFDLLYRWHGLVRDEIIVGNNTYKHQKYRFNNALLEDAGVGKIIGAASAQRAGKISLKNVPDFLLGAEYQTIKMGRDFRLRSYNDYREQFDLDRVTSFSRLTDDVDLKNDLKNLYGNIDNVEFTVGLFAEKYDESSLFGDLMRNMVAYDAFTQIYTNPLLSKNVYNDDTFTQYGLELINETNSLQDLVNRNIANGIGIETGFGL